MKGFHTHKKKDGERDVSKNVLANTKLKPKLEKKISENYATENQSAK